MIDPTAEDYTAQGERRVATEEAPAAEGLLAFIASFFAPFAHVDPRVITRQERHRGRTAQRF
jgi:hypothetical protein